jgi:hypothetical protein
MVEFGFAVTEWGDWRIGAQDRDRLHELVEADWGSERDDFFLRETQDGSLIVVPVETDSEGWGGASGQRQRNQADAVVAAFSRDGVIQRASGRRPPPRLLRAAHRPAGDADFKMTSVVMG